MNVIKERTLEALFNPRSIAIIGVSQDATRIGGRPLAYLLKNDYKGSIYPINPKYKEISGLTCYNNIRDVKDQIDLVIISLPQALVLDHFKECAELGVRTVVIFSAGFGEVDEEGERLQNEITSIAKKYNVRVLGPNTLGMFNVNKGVYATFSTILEHQTPIKGKIGFVSQSGAFGSHVFTLARQNQIGFSSFVATGNESDIGVADCIEYLAQDEETKVIACYIEGTKDGKKLINAFKLAAKNKKPIVMLKVGTTSAGKQAALSHTGSLAGSDEVYDAIFDQYGVYRAKTIDEFLAVANAFAELPIPKGDQVAIFTVSGGVGILLADQLTENSLSIKEPPKEVKDKLKEMLPIAGVNNPIDTTAQINAIPNLLEDFMDVVLSSGEYDGAVVFLAFTGLNKNTLDMRIESLNKVVSKYKDIPIISITLNDEDSRKKFVNNDLVVVDDPTISVQMMKALNGYRKYTELSTNVLEKRDNNTEKWSLKDSTILTEYEGKKIMKANNIPITNEALANSPEDAVKIAKSIGFPVVMKGMSKEILHKTDYGLVALHIENEEDVEKTYENLKGKINRIKDATFDGILIQEMLTDEAIEMFIGAKNDPVFGQVVLVGMGGIYIEILKDVAIRKAPISIEEAERMVNELRGSELLKGTRGKKPYDVKVLYETVASFSQFIANNEDVIEEIDLNPIMVFEEGKGVKAADALITLKNKNN